MNTTLLKGIAFILVIVGGINFGLFGLFEINLLTLFGKLYRLVLIVIGLAAGYLAYMRYVKKSF